MKKLTTLLLLSLLFFNCISQQTNPSPSLIKQDYLKKSKKQKTTAWLLFGSGLAMVGGGIAINLSGGILNGNGSKGLWLSYVGGAAVLTSIPLFIAASKNKRKAASLSFKNEPTLQLQKSYFVYRTIPSLALKFQL